MRWVLIVVGALLVLAGALWTRQGLNELGARRERPGAHRPAVVRAARAGVDVLAGPGRVGARLPQHPELGRAQPHAPLVLGRRELLDGNLVRHASTVRTARRTATAPGH